MIPSVPESIEVITIRYFISELRTTGHVVAVSTQILFSWWWLVFFTLDIIGQ